jgi:DNA/RNA-binding domain of Phe-tRNA-synthetase-like protein
MPQLQTTYFTNFARTTLAAAAAANAGVLTVEDAAAFPAAGVFPLVLTDAGETMFEVCRGSAKTATTIAVKRGQEGTAARAWPAGTKVEHRLTAETLNALCLALGV